MSYLKKIGALFVSSALLAAALTGCGSSSGSTSGTGSQAEGGDGNYNISIVFKTTSNEYTQYMIAGAKKAASSICLAAPSIISPSPSPVRSGASTATRPPMTSSRT